MTAAAAVAAAMVGAMALPAAAAGHQPGRMHRAVVHISGVQHAWQGREDRANRSLNKQWVDITNDSRRAMNLDSWALADRDGRTYTFHHVWLAGRATVRVHTGVGRDSRTDLYQDRRTRVWDVNADTATLRDARGRLVDAFSWGRSHRAGDMDRRAEDVNRRAADMGRHDGAGWHHTGLRHHGAGPRRHDVDHYLHGGVHYLHNVADHHHGDHADSHRR
ncbi:lamin tail domain-containing protein [Streptomyces sp. NPDC001093]|uniref:lamin tail domain-containing protein n=1 Tax=Streptomyces sp. NPDC001093 TaxID=3154376 RepID=UPI0033233102